MIGRTQSCGIHTVLETPAMQQQRRDLMIACGEHSEYTEITTICFRERDRESRVSRGGNEFVSVKPTLKYYLASHL